MEYVFGTQKDAEILKTKGSTHTDLSGFQQIVLVFPDGKYTHDFHVIRKTDSREDEAGICYDWYEIDRHSRMVDRTDPTSAIAKKNAAYIGYISMMTGVDLPDEGGEE